MALSLASISSDPVIAPPRIVIYGVHGVGKTTWAAGAPNAVLLPTEDGRGKLTVASFPILKSWQDVTEALGVLINGDHSYDVMIVDSLDWLEPLVWTETCKRKGFPDIESPGYGKGYLYAEEVWREFFEGLNVARREKGICAVLIAHTDIKAFNDPNSEPYDRYRIKLQTRAAALAEEWADCLLFANYRTHITKADVGFNKKVTRGVGVGERVLFTEERPGFRAKNRYDLPAEMPMPKTGGWDVLMNALAANTTSAAA